MRKPRTTPRISVNKLGEYLRASPSRRRAIIRDQKYPPAYQVARYADATRAITEFICQGQDEAALLKEKQRLLGAPASSEFDAQRMESCVEAIDCFLDLADQLELTDATPVAGPHEAPLLEVANVTISIRPEVLLNVQDRSGKQRTGLVKLYFAKSHPLDSASGNYVTALLQRYADLHLASRGPSDHRHIRLVDVFAGTVFTAPRASTRRMSDIEAACEEIAGRWAAI